MIFTYKRMFGTEFFPKYFFNTGNQTYSFS